MTRRTWVRLDNASNIFLAARSETDPKVFRVSADMDHQVDPVLLQSALDTTYDRYHLYLLVLPARQRSSPNRHRRHQIHVRPNL